MDRHRAVAAVPRADEPELAALLFGREGFLLVAGLESVALGQDPDLQEVHLVAFGGIELAVANARAGGHPLHVARFYDRAVAHAVLVLQRAVEDVGDDLHVTVAVRIESAGGLDPVLVDDAQGSEAHEARIVVVAERERVAAVQPAEVRAAAICRSTNIQHDDLLQNRCRVLRRIVMPVVIKYN